MDEQGGHAGEDAGPLARVASVGGHVARGKFGVGEGDWCRPSW